MPCGGGTGGRGDIGGPMSPGIEVGGAIDVGIPIDGGIPIGGMTFGIGGPTKREKFSIISYKQYAIA